MNGQGRIFGGNFRWQIWRRHEREIIDVFRETSKHKSPREGRDLEYSRNSRPRVAKSSEQREKSQANSGHMRVTYSSNMNAVLRLIEAVFLCLCDWMSWLSSRTWLAYVCFPISSSSHMDFTFCCLWAPLADTWHSARGMQIMPLNYWIKAHK